MSTDGIEMQHAPGYEPAPAYHSPSYQQQQSPSMQYENPPVHIHLEQQQQQQQGYTPKHQPASQQQPPSPQQGFYVPGQTPQHQSQQQSRGRISRVELDERKHVDGNGAPPPTLPNGALGNPPSARTESTLYSLDVHTEPDTHIPLAKQWVLLSGPHVVAGHTIYQPTSSLDPDEKPFSSPGLNPVYAQNTVHVLFDHISYVLYQSIKIKPSELISYAPDLQPSHVRWLIASTRAAAAATKRVAVAVIQKATSSARSLRDILINVMNLCIMIVAFLIASLVIAIMETGSKGTVDNMQKACILVFVACGVLILACIWHYKHYRQPSFIQHHHQQQQQHDNEQQPNPKKTRYDGVVMVLLLFALLFCGAATASGIYFLIDTNKSPTPQQTQTLNPTPGPTSGPQTWFIETIIHDWTSWQVFTCANYDYSCDTCKLPLIEYVNTTMSAITTSTITPNQAAINASRAQAEADAAKAAACSAEKENRNEFCPLNDNNKNMCMLPERISAGALVVCTILSLVFLLIIILLLWCGRTPHKQIPSIAIVIPPVKELSQLYTQITLYGPPQHGFPVRVLLSASDAISFQTHYTNVTTQTVALPGMRLHTKATTTIDHQHAQVNTIPPTNLSKSFGTM